MVSPSTPQRDEESPRAQRSASVQTATETRVRDTETNASKDRIDFKRELDQEPTFVVAGIPAYNEESSIGSVVSQTAPHVDAVLVVDDGSEDATAGQARRAGAWIIEHGENHGYGAALKTLFDTAVSIDAGALVVLDGDGQHDVEDIPDLLAAQEETGADIVIGSRFVPGASGNTPLYRQIGLAIVNHLTNIGLRFRGDSNRIADTQSGFRLYSRTAIESLANDGALGEGMDASLGILFHAAEQDFSVHEIPTEIAYDVEAPSSEHPVRHGLSLIARITREIVRTPPARSGLIRSLGGVGALVGILWLAVMLERISMMYVALVIGLLGIFGLLRDRPN